MTRQITSNILMLKPVGFRMNEQTIENNYYQKVLENIDEKTVQKLALEEFNAFVDKLRSYRINVMVVEDTAEPSTPDSIFPNNWISFHQDGRVGLYPMFAVNRRLERRDDIIDRLQLEFGFDVEEIVDFTEFEEHDRFLEGTGSMILDRVNRIVYAAISIRTDKKALELFAEQFDYSLVPFISYQTVKSARLPIYHTNVMMCLAESFAVICLETIDDAGERKKVVDSLTKTGKEIIEISESQVSRFAGNMLQVENLLGDKFLVMSSSAFESLTSKQRNQLECFQPIIHSSLDTIEACGGGSARCMMAEVFLPLI